MRIQSAAAGLVLAVAALAGSDAQAAPGQPRLSLAGLVKPATGATTKVQLAADKAANNAVVSLGVPFAPGALTDPSLIAVLDQNGKEIASYSKSLATWPEGGSQRSVLVAFRATMSAGEKRTYTIRYGVKRTATAAETAPNPDGPVVATLSPEWYAKSLVIGQQVPAAKDTAFKEWESILESALGSMSPAWTSYALSCASTNSVRTYYDGPHALYQRFIHRGGAEAYRRARVEAKWYRDNELVWFDNHTVAVHACVPVWDPKKPLDWDQNRWVPIRRLTNEGQLDDYLLTGDPKALETVRGIGEAFRQNLPALINVQPETLTATERNMGWTMIGLASYYAVDHSAKVKSALDTVVGEAQKWQAQGTSGAFEHDIVYADPAECSDGPKGGSPFMTSILIDGLMTTWSLTHDQRIPDVVVKTAEWLRDDAITSDGEAFQYLWHCNDVDYDDSSTADLNLLIAHVFGAAYVFTKDTSWLDFGDTMAYFGIDALWAKKPKQWSQATRSFMKYMGYRSLGRTP